MSKLNPFTKGKTLVDSNTPAPRLPQSLERTEPTEAYRRRLSDAAAEQAQRWIDIETDLGHTREELQRADARCLVLEEAGKLLNATNLELKDRNERLIRENTRLHERIKTAAEVLVGLSQPLPPEDENRAVEAVEAAIEMPHADVIPERDR